MTITSRIDAVTAIPAEYRQPFMPAPRSVKIELSGACNYHCSFCVRSVRENADGTMDRKLYSSIIKQLAVAGVEEVGLFYIGESFMCRWLPDAIREAKAAGIGYVFLTTNGSMATPERVHACMEAGLDSLKFSLNYADGEQLHAVADVRPHLFERTLHHIRQARALRDENGYKCGIYASSIAFTGEQGDKMHATVESIRPWLDEHYWLPLFDMGGANEGKARVSGNPGRLGNMREPLPCWSVTTGHVTHEGKLSACCFGVGADDTLVMGDLREQTFMEAWNSPVFQELRAAHFRKDVRGTPCEKCIAA